MNKIILLLVFGLCTAQITAQTLTLEQAMAHPDWLGRQPQQPYWSDDSESVYYRRKRISVEQTDLFRVSINGQTIEQIYPEDFSEIDIDSDSISPNGRLKAYAREGDIYVKELRSGDITQLTRTAAIESSPLFTANSDKGFFSRDDIILVRDLGSGLESQAADIRFEDPPAEEENSYLNDQQIRLFDIIQLQAEREDLEEEYDNENQDLDSSRIDLPYYLGENNELIASALSPNQDWLLIATRNKTERNPGRVGSMPVFVTASGYVENREVRSRVGTADFAAQHLYLLNLKEHRIAEIDLSKLPTVKGNPLRDQLGDNYPESEDVNKIRELFFVNLQWSDDGSKLSKMILLFVVYLLYIIWDIHKRLMKLKKYVKIKIYF